LIYDKLTNIVKGKSNKNKQGKNYRMRMFALKYIASTGVLIWSAKWSIDISCM